MGAKKQFEKTVTEMIRADAHWHGSGSNVTLTDSELKTFLDHLWTYFLGEGPNYDEEGLARALIATDGKFQSSQDRAKFIIKALKLTQGK